MSIEQKLTVSESNLAGIKHKITALGQLGLAYFTNMFADSQKSIVLERLQYDLDSPYHVFVGSAARGLTIALVIYAAYNLFRPDLEYAIQTDNISKDSIDIVD